MIIHAMSEKETPVILNVDDDKTDRYATSRILSSAGFRVSEAATGYEAITLIKDLPDLVVLDVNLPDITGFEVCKRIKENASTQHIPVLYLSATFVDTKAKVEGLNVGGDGYLVQPVEPSLLIATIHSLLRIKRSEDALKRTLEEKDRYIIELKQLMAFSDQMSVDTQEADFIKHTGMVLKKQFSIDMLAIVMLNREKNMLEAAFTEPPMSIDSFITNEAILNPSLCCVMQQGQGCIVRDIHQDPLCNCLQDNLKEGECLYTPLITGDTVAGYILMVKEEKFSWDKETLKLISTYSRLASLTLHRVRLMDTLKFDAVTDVLTGIYNRRFFNEMLEKQISVARRRNEKLSLLMADLDHFKIFNDTYGHTAGDLLLKKIAGIMGKSIRLSDILARYGGEEFVIIMPMTDLASALQKAEQIRRHVASADSDYIVPGKSPRTTISIGVATFPEHGTDVTSLLNAADRALYKVKREGRNNVATV